jgi:hypothetical protein
MLRAFCQGLVTGWTSILGLSGGLLARLARVVSLGAIAGCLERWGAVGAGHGVRLGLGILVAHRTCADPSRAHAHKHIQTYRHIHTQASDALTQARTRTHTTNDTHTHARTRTYNLRCHAGLWPWASIRGPSQRKTVVMFTCERVRG